MRYVPTSGLNCEVEWMTCFAGRVLPWRAFPPLLLIASCALPLACASRGAGFHVDRLPHVKRGVTTQQEIRAWFGPPLSIQTWGSGGSRWRYFHEETTQQDTATLRKFVRFIAALFGWRIFAPPVDVAYAKTVRHELEVFFDANGVVRDTVYKREEMPTRRVY